MILLDNGDEMIAADSEDTETDVKPKHIIFVNSKEEGMQVIDNLIANGFYYTG